MYTSDFKLSRMKDKTPVAVKARCTAMAKSIPAGAGAFITFSLFAASPSFIMNELFGDFQVHHNSIASRLMSSSIPGFNPR